MKNGTTISFLPPTYESDRILLACGLVNMGAIFPPVGDDRKWRWRLFAFGDFPVQEGVCTSQDKAKGALLQALVITLGAARLVPVRAEDV